MFPCFAANRGGSGKVGFDESIRLVHAIWHHRTNQDLLSPYLTQRQIPRDSLSGTPWNYPTVTILSCPDHPGGGSDLALFSPAVECGWVDAELG